MRLICEMRYTALFDCTCSFFQRASDRTRSRTRPLKASIRASCSRLHPSISPRIFRSCNNKKENRFESFCKEIIGAVKHEMTYDQAFYLNSKVMPNWVAFWFKLQQQPSCSLQLKNPKQCDTLEKMKLRFIAMIG